MLPVFSHIFIALAVLSSVALALPQLDDDYTLTIVPRRQPSGQPRVRLSSVVKEGQRQGNDFKWEPFSKTPDGKVIVTTTTIKDEDMDKWRNSVHQRIKRGLERAEDHYVYDSEDLEKRDAWGSIKPVLCYGSGTWLRRATLTGLNKLLCDKVSGFVSPGTNQIMNIQLDAEGQQIVDIAGRRLNVFMQFRTIAGNYQSGWFTSVICSASLSYFEELGCSAGSTT